MLQILGGFAGRQVTLSVVVGEALFVFLGGVDLVGRSVVVNGVGFIFFGLFLFFLLERQGVGSADIFILPAGVAPALGFRTRTRRGTVANGYSTLRVPSFAHLVSVSSASFILLHPLVLFKC